MAGGKSVMSRSERWATPPPGKTSFSTIILRSSVRFREAPARMQRSGARSKPRTRAAHAIGNMGQQTLLKIATVDVLFYLPGRIPQGKAGGGLCRGAGGARKGWSALRAIWRGLKSRLELTGYGRFPADRTPTDSRNQVAEGKSAAERIK
jgi:hypothetical protein